MTAPSIPSWLREQLGTDAALRAANHWVPLAYLKSFTNTGDGNGALCLYDRETPNQPRSGVGPRVIARENLLYRVTSIPDLPDIAERVLSLVEGPYPQLRNRLICSHHLGGFYSNLKRQDRWDLALFLAMQQGRTPYHRDVTQEVLSIFSTVQAVGRLYDVETVQNDFELLRGERIRADEIEQWRTQLQKGQLLLEPDTDHWVANFLSAAIEVAKTIMTLPYRVAKAARGTQFPTSDLPVVLARRRLGTVDYALSAGWLEPDAEITLTLDPSHVLIVGPLVDDPFIGSYEWSESVVKRTVEHSNRFVFAQQVDPFISRVLGDSQPPVSVLEIDGREYDLRTTSRDQILHAIEKGRSSIIRFGRPIGRNPSE